MKVRMPTSLSPSPDRNGTINAVRKDDFPVHNWYRFVLSYPPHLVRKYLSAFSMDQNDLVLDPFCGTGTTLVECKKNGIPSVGCDAHPFAALVSRVKTDWDLDAGSLKKNLKRILRKAGARGNANGLEALSFDAALLQETTSTVRSILRLTDDEEKLLPTGFLSLRPLQRLLILRDEIYCNNSNLPERERDFFLVAFAHVVANGAGNFSFGPEIYRTKAKPDYDVLGHFARHGEAMIQQLTAVRLAGPSKTAATVFSADARTLEQIPDGISAVITSPPYPNEKDYTRTTRVESILLRLVTDKTSLRDMKESLLRSNTRNVFVRDRDGEEVRDFASIQKVCRTIEERRIELNKDSGFERLYHKVVSHYFGGMRRHLRALKPKLKRKAKLAYVVGDQLSFLMVPVATATLLSEVAAAEGYKTTGIELWRERVGTKVRNSITNQKTVRVREEVLILEND
jgi:DNA modification methylase